MCQRKFRHIKYTCRYSYAKFRTFFGPSSIFTAELVALNLALDIVWHSRLKKSVIFSDSLSCLLGIQNVQAESGYVMKFLKNYTALVNTGRTVLLRWVPGHVGIKGLVLKVMNKRMMWPKWHFILLYLQ